MCTKSIGLLVEVTIHLLYVLLLQKDLGGLVSDRSFAVGILRRPSRSSPKTLATKRHDLDNLLAQFYIMVSRIFE